MGAQVVTGKPGESIFLGNEVTVKGLDVQGLQVRIEVEFPRNATASGEEFAEFEPETLQISY